MVNKTAVDKAVWIKLQNLENNFEQHLDKVNGNYDKTAQINLEYFVEQPLYQIDKKKALKEQLKN